MDPRALLESFRRKVCGRIDIEPAGVDRYVIYTPFMFDDGDHFVTILRKDSSGWFLTDEGHTLSHLSYGHTDVTGGTRGAMLDEALAAHRVENRDGELRLSVPREEFGDALYSFLQAASRIATIAQMTHERAATTFMDDFGGLLSEILPPERVVYDWHDPVRDPDGKYLVDCRINGSRKPCLVFGVNSTSKCSHATITCLTLERWGMPFRSVVLFEDQTKIGRRQLAQLSDVVGKQFASLGERDRIRAYFSEEVLSSGV
jgi:hypothetical protein